MHVGMVRKKRPWQRANSKDIREMKLFLPNPLGCPHIFILKGHEKGGGLFLALCHYTHGSLKWFLTNTFSIIQVFCFEILISLPRDKPITPNLFWAPASTVTCLSFPRERKYFMLYTTQRSFFMNRCLTLRRIGNK